MAVVPLPAGEMTDERCLRGLREVAEPLKELSAESVFLVADSRAYRASGAEVALAPLLDRYRTTVFEEFEPNPKLPDIEAGLQWFRRSPSDVVLAVGGGTAIDIAKLIAGFGVQTADPRSIILGRQPLAAPSIPLIAVPTTSGTGSEATQFAVVYVDGAKHSVDHPTLLPRWCVLDPALTAGLPPRITATTGLDALCQGIESLWSVRSTEKSAAFASEAVRLAWAHLADAVHAPTPASRAAMCRAAHLAGRAINITRTTAPHAISYALTSDYGIPHGHAVALTLGRMLVHNGEATGEDHNDPHGVAHVRGAIEHVLSLLGCATAAEGGRRWETVVRSLGCATRLSELGIAGDQALWSIARKVNTERLSNNPRRLSAEQLVALLRSIG